MLVKNKGYTAAAYTVYSISAVLMLSSFFLSSCSMRKKNPAVIPVSSLYASVNNEWLAETSIPSDQPGVTNFSILKDSIDQELVDLIDTLESAETRSQDEEKVLALYTSFMNVEKRNQLGILPLRGDLDRIEEIKSYKEVILNFAQANKHGVSTPVMFAAEVDFLDSRRAVLWASQAGLGISTRDLYLQNDERAIRLQTAYKQYLQTLFSLAKISSAEEKAQQVFELERKLAKIQWSPEDNRDFAKIYNPRNISQLNQQLSNYFLNEYLSSLDLPRSVTFNLQQPSYVAQLNKLFPQVSIEQWKDYLRARYLTAYAELLSDEFRQASVVYQQTQGLIEQESPLWKQGLQFTQATASMLVGKLWVARNFNEQTKAQVEVVVKNIQEAAKVTLTKSKRLSATTKRKALEKLSQMSFNVGYPDTWQDYSTLSVSADDLVGNYRRATAYELKRNREKLNKKVDRNEWDRSPQEVNAFYDPTKNKFVLLAGILKPPFYNKDAGPAEIYGGIGFVVGHEIGHAFDDMGSQFDGQGNMKNWWQKSDRTAFQAVKKNLITQANAFEVLPGVTANGELEIGEIMGDLTGAQLALVALGKEIDKDLLNLNEQHRRFFTQLAKVWREKLRPEFQRLILAVDPHPPGAFRADGISKNLSEFHAAFETKPGDAMYLEPKKRMQVW